MPDTPEWVIELLENLYNISEVVYYKDKKEAKKNRKLLKKLIKKLTEGDKDVYKE